jgi:hypothetical protein
VSMLAGESSRLGRAAGFRPQIPRPGRSIPPREQAAAAGHFCVDFVLSVGGRAVPHPVEAKFCFSATARAAFVLSGQSGIESTAGLVCFHPPSSTDFSFWISSPRHCLFGEFLFFTARAGGCSASSCRWPDRAGLS